MDARACQNTSDCMAHLHDLRNREKEFDILNYLMEANGEQSIALSKN
jgi:hypothetical protein